MSEDVSDLSVPNHQPSCSMCHRPITTTAAGLIRQCGPVRSGCPGSRQPPGTLTTVQQPPTEPREQGVEAVTVATSPTNLTSSVTSGPLQRMSARALKRLPKASREGAVRKLASILDVLVTKNDYALWVRIARAFVRANVCSCKVS